jgi:RimJ/RimL family protein N-acetyltransferase
MTVKLLDVYRVRDPHVFLYQLLDERPPEASISHHSMPTMEAHRAFVLSHPYRCWYIVQNGTGLWVGAVYATFQNEVGIGVLREFQRQGYAKAAVRALLEEHGPLPSIPGRRAGRYLANVAPQNHPSHALFRALGGRLIQHTYEF